MIISKVVIHTICKFLRFLISDDMYSKSLSPKYRARSVSKTKHLSQPLLSAPSTYIPIMKKFPGRFFSFKLLYVRSNTSKTGKAPNPLGSEYSRFSDKFKMRSFGIDDKDRGSSSIWLLARFRISKLVRLAKPGGTAIKLYYFSFWKANLRAGLVLHFSLL